MIEDGATCASLRDQLPHIRRTEIMQTSCITICIGAVALVGCREVAGVASIVAPLAPSASIQTSNTRGRAADTTHASWTRKTDEELWQAVVAAESVVVVGVKNTSDERGVSKGQLLISEAEKLVAHNTLASMPGVSVVRALRGVPAYAMRIHSYAQLAALRHHPMVDYVEPARWREPRSIWLSSGCDYIGPSSPTNATSEGDVFGWSYDGFHHHIAEAWQRATGRQVRVAVLDTGLDPAQSQLNAYFASGLSAGRTLNVGYSEPASISPEWRDLCGHGTRIFGVIGAPRDGRGTVGVAYGADMLSMRVASDVDDWFNEIDVSDGLYAAVGGWGARVVEMAFGASNFSEAISDYIQITFYRTGGPLYVAAMGNYNSPDASFPADMDEVIGVVALNEDGTRNGSSNWGPSAELGGYQPAIAPGNISLGHADIADISATSAASATIAGIAALVFEVHPDWSNSQVRARLQLSGTHPYDTNWQNGHGPVDAYKAAGGTRYVQVEGPACAPRGEMVSIQANPDGDGPFAYAWSTGSTEDNTLVTASNNIGETTHVDVGITDVRSGQHFSASYDLLTVQYESGNCGPN